MAKAICERASVRADFEERARISIAEHDRMTSTVCGRAGHDRLNARHATDITRFVTLPLSRMDHALATWPAGLEAG